MGCRVLVKNLPFKESVLSSTPELRCKSWRVGKCLYPGDGEEEEEVETETGPLGRISRHGT